MVVGWEGKQSCDGRVQVWWWGGKGSRAVMGGYRYRGGMGGYRCGGGMGGYRYGGGMGGGTEL